MGASLGAAAWMMDAGALRATLDRLRDALEQPVSFVGGAPHGHDQRAIAESLRVLLAKLDGVDLGARQAMSGFVREHRPDEQVRTLRALFDGLQDGWNKRVARILGASKLSLVQRLVSSPSPDVLRILGREHDENSHSDLIAWLLSPYRAPNIAPSALRAMAARFTQPTAWTTCIDAAVASGAISIRREMQIGRELANSDDLCRVDLVVSGPGFVLAIENKVWSSEHSDQTSTYWKWLAPMRGLRGGIFLSPNGMAAACADFLPMSYLELVSVLLEGPLMKSLSSAEEIVLGSYLKTIAGFILPVEMRAAMSASNGMEEE